MKNETFKSYLSGLSVTDTTDYSLWKATRRMQRPSVQVPSIRKRDGTWARSEQEKSEIYARHHECVFLSNAINPVLDIVKCQQLNVKRLNISLH